MVDLRHGETLQRARELPMSLGEAAGSHVVGVWQTSMADCVIGTHAVLRGLRASDDVGLCSTNQVRSTYLVLGVLVFVTLIQHFHNAKSVMPPSLSHHIGTHRPPTAAPHPHLLDLY